MTSALEIHRKKHYVAAKMATETIGLSLFSQSFVDKQLQININLLYICIQCVKLYVQRGQTANCFCSRYVKS